MRADDISHGVAEKHVDGTKANSELADNPVRGSLDIVVSVPDSIKIRMVDASTLADYETWIFLASVLSNAVVGFLVATVQAYDTKTANAGQLKWTTIVCLILFLSTLGKALLMRHALTKQGKNIKLKATEAESIKK
jgi:hypothetical protein